MSSSASNKKRQSSGGPLDGGGNNDAIKVVCRFRPERSGPGNSKPGNNSSSKPDSFVLNPVTGEVKYASEFSDNRSFLFDKIFDGSTTQPQIFQEVGSVVDSVMAGLNGTVMAYGQTSAGKSFTMEGPSLTDPALKGITPRCIDKLFDCIQQADSAVQFQVVVSYFEVYCEKVRDLLNPSQTNMKVREHNKTGFIIQDLTEIPCTDKTNVLRVIELGQANRAAAPTLMNAESSRSHSIFTLLVEQRHMETGRVKRAKLYLVDLAGSEKVSKTGASGTRLEEAKNINSSLTTLGMCINALSDGAGHIPYRDSKLTMLLSDALGGNSKTTLVICCTPESTHVPETLSTLRFGERAKKIVTHARVNEEMSVEELKMLLMQARKEIARLKRDRGESTTTESSLTADELSTPLSAPPSPMPSSGPHPLEEEVARLQGQVAALEEEVENEKLRCLGEKEEKLRYVSEVEALGGVIKDLEDRLLKETMKHKNGMDSGDRGRASSFSPSFTPNPLAEGSDSDDEAAVASHTTPTVTPVKDSQKGKAVETAADGVDLSFLDSLTTPIPLTPTTPHPVTPSTSFYNPSQMSATSSTNYAEKYVKLREEYEGQVQRLMTKLVTEQQVRANLEEKLEEAYNKIWVLEGGEDRWPANNSSGSYNAAERRRSSLGATRHDVTTPSSSGAGILSTLFGAVGGAVGSAIARSPVGQGGFRGRSNTRASFSDREQNLSRSLDLAQSRVSSLLQELEILKEAQGIVLETKECVMRSLARQNSQLLMERDALQHRNEELLGSVNQLTTLLRSMQTRGNAASNLPSRRMSSFIKGGAARGEDDDSGDGSRSGDGGDGGDAEVVETVGDVTGSDNL